MNPNGAIEIVYPNDNNNNNNKKKTNHKKGAKEWTRRRRGGIERGEERRDIFILFFLLFASFSYLRKSDRRFSSELKAKLIYAISATREHQKVGVLTNSVR